MGTNEHGVSHFANGLADYEWKLGLPHYPLKRTLFEQRDVAACLELVEKHHMCSAANMVFCDGDDDIADVEIRPEGIALFEDNHADKRLHTNHYITERFAPFETNGATDSAPRIQRIRQLVSERWGQLRWSRLRKFYQIKREIQVLSVETERAARTRSLATNPSQSAAHSTLDEGTAAQARGPRTKCSV